MAFFKNLAVACALAGTVACTDQSQDATPDSIDALGPGEVATVNGERIPESLFRLVGLRSLQKNAEDMTDAEREQVMNQIINLKLLAEAGLARRLDQERTIAAELELLRLQTLANWAIRRHVEENPPAEFELRALYEERIQNLSGTEYNARHILVDSREEADHVIDLLDDGGEFAALAEEYSTGPTGPNGGQLDWFTPDSMVQPFADAVQAMEVGTYTSEPIQTQFGWHVILLQDTREQQPPGLESMRTELTTLAERQKMQDYVDTLRDAATVEIVE